MKYSIDEIKKAFWATFHESGELWFDYLTSKEESESSTQEKWKWFDEELRKLQPEDRAKSIFEHS